MHVDRADQVAVTAKPTGPARPISALGLVLMSTYRTPATGPSFGAGEAHDVGLLCFMAEVVNIFAVFPQRHALVVMPSFILVAHPMGIANEEGPDLVFDTEVDHLPGRFVAQITNTALCPSALLVFRALQLLPATGILLAPGLLFRQ